MTCAKDTKNKWLGLQLYGQTIMLYVQISLIFFMWEKVQSLFIIDIIIISKQVEPKQKQPKNEKINLKTKNTKNN